MAVPFKKGFDPRRNLEGNKGSKHFTTIVKAALSTLAKIKMEDGSELEMSKEEALAQSIVNRAIRKSDKLAELVWNYLDGKPIQGLILGGDADNPIVHDIRGAVGRVYGKRK